MFLILSSMIYGIKLTSYAHVIRNVYFTLGWMKRAQKEKKDYNDLVSKNLCSEEEKKYIQKFLPDSIKILCIKHFFYFILAPTLCF